MPELPEVETIVRQLASVLPGRLISSVDVRREDLLREDAASFASTVAGSRIRSVGRRGKNLVIGLATDTKPMVLLVNLGMTGRMLVQPASEAVAHPSHLGLAFYLSPPGVLFYADARRFGRLVLLSSGEWQQESRRLGIEPLEPGLSPNRLHRLLSASRAPIRSWLLDQTKLAGIGNIYAAEALFRARIHPAREARSLSRGEAAALLTAIRSVLRGAIRSRGTTLRDYRTTTGGEGGFKPSLKVYGREGEPCPRCKARIRRLVLANRSAFFCPSCQREAPRSDT